MAKKTDVERARENLAAFEERRDNLVNERNRLSEELGTLAGVDVDVMVNEISARQVRIAALSAVVANLQLDIETAESVLTDAICAKATVQAADARKAKWAAVSDAVEALASVADLLDAATIAEREEINAKREIDPSDVSFPRFFTMAAEMRKQYNSLSLWTTQNAQT